MRCDLHHIRAQRIRQAQGHSSGCLRDTGQHRAPRCCVDPAGCPRGIVNRSQSATRHRVYSTLDRSVVVQHTRVYLHLRRRERGIDKTALA